MIHTGLLAVYNVHKASLNNKASSTLGGSGFQEGTQSVKDKLERHSQAPTKNGACKLFNIHLHATLCFNYFRRHRPVFIQQCV